MEDTQVLQLEKVEEVAVARTTEGVPEGVLGVVHHGRYILVVLNVLHMAAVVHSVEEVVEEVENEKARGEAAGHGNDTWDRLEEVEVVEVVEADKLGIERNEDDTADEADMVLGDVLHKVLALEEEDIPEPVDSLQELVLQEAEAHTS